VSAGAARARRLGCCYYPEQWREDLWAEDAARMVQAGLSLVRIGEFAWSRIEPNPGDMRWDWLDRAVEVLGDAGLEVVLGTPTATPPRWMLERHPDMLAVDRDGRPRGFGSRRHYDFSHRGYRDEARRITTLMAARYGRVRHVAAWQIDNEYGCHDTVRSYSPAALADFQRWLARRYDTIGDLNAAWCNIFWSMTYRSFEEIGLPTLTVTEPNPAHVLDFARFASDAVVAWNRAMATAIRSHATQPLIHNYMGREVAFDHYAVGRDLEIASWDSYPIGFLSDRLEASDAHKARFLRQGDPDMQAFHHDLYRSVGAQGTGGPVAEGRWWVMEQQPGPVNWAPYNPAPLPGMVRLWSWEAFAHGAEAVVYFRWRQAPFAQEQMHAGLLRPDSVAAPGLAEAAQVASEIAAMPAGDAAAGTAPSPVALIFDYASCWAWEAQPQGADFDGFRLALAAYRAARQAGLDIDILPPDTADLSGYRLVLAPGLLTLSPPLRGALARFEGVALIGPRSDVKTEALRIPVPMGPDLPGVDVTSVLTESLPPGETLALSGGGAVAHWVETLEGDAEVFETLADGRPALMGDARCKVLAGWPDAAGFARIVAEAAQAAGLETETLPDGLRLRRTGAHVFAFNYGPAPVTWRGVEIPTAGVHWRARESREDG
jgi:beta-galactosidase